MILPPRVSRALGKRLPRVVVDFPYEGFMATVGLVTTAPILADLVYAPLLMVALPPLAAMFWGSLIFLASCSLIFAIHHREPQMISASLWLSSLCSLAYVFMFLASPDVLSWLVISVGLLISIFGLARAIYWGSLARIMVP